MDNTACLGSLRHHGPHTTRNIPLPVFSSLDGTLQNRKSGSVNIRYSVSDQSADMRNLLPNELSGRSLRPLLQHVHLSVAVQRCKLKKRGQRKYCKVRCEADQGGSAYSSAAFSEAARLSNVEHLNITEPLSDNFYVSSVTVNPLWIAGEAATLDFSTTPEKTHSKNQKDVSLEKAFRESRLSNEIEEEAWMLLRRAVVNYCGNPVGTVAANDPSDSTPLNYDQVFVRDFIPSALAFLLKGEPDIVRNFLLHTLQLQVPLILFSPSSRKYPS